MTVVTGWITGGLMTLLGMVGLFLAAHAVDSAMSIFGVGMFVFAVLFDFWIVKLVADERDQRLHS